jgi:arginyl-tRNA synthetase
MKKYLSKLVSGVLGEMMQSGEIPAMPAFLINVPKEEHGDYVVHVAHVIAKETKRNPKEVAEVLADKIKTADVRELFESVQAVNGFVNVRLSASGVAENVLAIQNEIQIEQVGLDQMTNQPRKVVFEYSSPNTNKALHIGHLRNDVFGASCINLLKAVGYDVIACEIINDRGIHIMKSMLMYQKYGNGSTPESEGLKSDHFVGKYYSMFSQKCSESEEQKLALEEEAQELLRKWESADPEVRALWQKMNNWFFEGVKVTYDLEGTHFDDVEFESSIYDKGRDLVLKGVELGVFQREDDGSVSVDLTSQGLDKKYLLRKDGTTIYITQDLYLWSLRNEKFHPEMAIVVTSAEQSYHFKVLKALFELLNFPWVQNFKHLAYEHVFFGKTKASSRAGNSVTSDDLLRTIEERVRETMRNSKKIKASPDDLEVVQAIAFAAIKYGYLKYDPNTLIYFDLDETIAIEGNTGPYLQYTYARINSILEKAGEFEKLGPYTLTEPSETSLARFLLHYGEVVAQAAQDYKPTSICNYAFELAQKFNQFYDQVSVLNADTEELKNQRLTLLVSVAKVLKHSLGLLGIKTVDKI